MTGHLLNVYNRAPVTFTHGEGSWLIAENGDRYLDCVGETCNAMVEELAA